MDLNIPDVSDIIILSAVLLFVALMLVYFVSQKNNYGKRKK